MNKRLLVTLFSLAVVISGTIVAIKFAQGYRPSRSGMITGTGLLNANSFPTGASLYINGNLSSATDTTLNLAPGEYRIEIRKDGYSPWEKTLQIEKELVTQTNALLLPSTPSLTPITFTGATAIHPSPDGQRILYVTASASASRRNGLYVMDLTDSPLALQRGPRQIAVQEDGWDFSSATLLWSPTSDQILVSLNARTVLLDANRMNDVGAMQDVTIRLPQIYQEWEQELYQREREELLKFPPEIVSIATQSASHYFIAPDREKIMYVATKDLTLPQTLVPPVPAASTQRQVRNLVPGGVYVYDAKEDRNFQVASLPQASATPTASPRARAKTQQPVATPSALPQLLVNLGAPLQTLQASPSAFLQLYVRGDTVATARNFQMYYSSLYSGAPQWLPDSRHLILREPERISIITYDGTNKTQVYAGPFHGNFVYPWPNGSKLVIVTNLNQGAQVPYNLYALGLR